MSHIVDQKARLPAKHAAEFQDAINYVGPLVVYKIVDPHNYLLMTIDGKLLRGLFEHKRLKPAMIRMDKGNVNTLLALKRVMHLEIST